MWVATGCRCSTRARPGCTGRRRSMARNITAARGRAAEKGNWMWRWRLGLIRLRRWREFFRCRRIWTNSCSRDFCGASRWRWWLARLRSGSSGECGNRAGRLCGFIGDADRRAVRRSHRILFARGRISRVSHHLHHASQGSDLSDDDCGAAAAGRFLDGACDRARFLSGDEDAVSGNCGCGDAGGGDLSEFDDCGDSRSPIRATRGRS